MGPTRSCFVRRPNGSKDWVRVTDSPMWRVSSRPASSWVKLRVRPDTTMPVRLPDASYDQVVVAPVGVVRLVLRPSSS